MHISGALAIWSWATALGKTVSNFCHNLVVSFFIIILNELIYRVTYISIHHSFSKTALRLKVVSFENTNIKEKEKYHLVFEQHCKQVYYITLTTTNFLCTIVLNRAITAVHYGRHSKSIKITSKNKSNEINHELMSIEHLLGKYNRIRAMLGKV